MLKIFDDLLFSIVIADLITSKLLNYAKLTKLSIFLITFVGISLLWGLAEDNGIKVLALAIRQNKNILLCLYIAVFNNRDEDFIYTLINKLLFISVPVAIIQRIISTHRMGDDVVGVFGYGQSGTLSLLILIFFFTEVYRRLNCGEKVFGKYWLILIPTMLNETKITYVLFPLLLFTILILAKKINIRTIIIGGLMIPLFIFVSDKAYQSLYGNSLSEVFSPEYIDNYMYGGDEEGDVGRFLRILIAYDYLENSSRENYLLGYGTGSSFVGKASGTYGVIARRFIGTRLNEGSRVQLYQFLIEYGVLGSFLFISWFIIVLLVILRQKNLNRVNIVSILLIMITLISLVYQNILINRIPAFLLFYYLFLSLDQGRLTNYEEKTSNC